MKTAKDVLTIIAKTNTGIAEISGLEFHGIWQSAPPDESAIQTEEIWPAEAVKIYKGRIVSKEYCEISANIRIDTWPPEAKWHEMIHKTLEAFLNAGAFLSFCGGHSCNAWPYYYFSPDIAGYVYAASTRKTGFMCNSGLNDEVAFLNPWQHAKIIEALRAGGFC